MVLRVYQEHRELNDLGKRSTRQVFYNFITKYIDIFVDNMRQALAMRKLLTVFQQKILAYFIY